MGQQIFTRLFKGLAVTSDGRVSHEKLIKYVSEDEDFTQIESHAEALNAIKGLTPTSGAVGMNDVEQALRAWDETKFFRILARLRAKRVKRNHDLNTNAEVKEKDQGGAEIKNEDMKITRLDSEISTPQRITRQSSWGSEAIGDDGWGEDGEADNVDWGEGDTAEDGDGWGEIKEEKEFEETVKPKKVGSCLIVDEPWFIQEVRKRSRAVEETLNVPLGVATNMLRGYKWSSRRAQNAFLEDTKCARTKTNITHPAIEHKGTMVRCMLYSGVWEGSDKGKKSESARPSRENVALVDKVAKLIGEGKTMPSILKALKKAHGVKNIMQAYQKAQARRFKSSESEPETPCQAGKGLVPASKATILRCGHGACDNCWKGVLAAQIKGGMECINLGCQVIMCGKKSKSHRHKSDLGCFCEERVPREVFEKYLDKESVDVYDKWVANSFAQTSETIAHCPKAGCEYWIQQTDISNRVTCFCGHSFCFKCQRKPHNPVPCKQFEDFQMRAKPDYLEQLWLKMNTTQCPQCNTNIEKNRACLHMTCRCGHNFCWACKIPWSKAGHNYYNCKSYKKMNEAKQREINQQKANKELSKFRWYEKQMDISRTDIKEAKEFKSKMEAQMAKKSRDYRVYKFIFEALDTFIRAKEEMLHMSIIAFYFKGGDASWNCPKCTLRNTGSKACSACGTLRRGNSKTTKLEVKTDTVKALFNFQQKMMVKVTNNLLKIFTDKQIDELLQSKKEVITVANACGKFVDEMVKKIESGEFDAYILDAPDLSTEGWFCVRCEHMNKFSSQTCTSGKCDACQVHGEFACLRCKPGS